MKAKNSFTKTQYKARIDIKMEGLNFGHKKDYSPTPQPPINER